MPVYEDIYNFSDAKVRCGLCDKYISNHHGCIDTHIDGANHSNLYLERLEIRNSIKVYSDCVYCSICNCTVDQSESLKSIQNHITNKYHMEYMGWIDYLISGEFLDLPDVIDDGPKVRCTICEYSIGFTIKDIKTHVESRSHERARAIAVQPLHGIFAVENNDDELWCKICDAYFDNDVESILEHVDKDTDHNEKLGEIEDLIEDKDIDIEEYLTVVGEDKAECNRCQVKIPCNAFNLKQHINGCTHKN